MMAVPGHLPIDEGQTGSTAVVVASCWRFRQVWNPFFILFGRYWPDCPYKIVLSTDTGTHPCVEALQVGKDLGWSSNLMRNLQRLAADRVILLQEDFLLTAPADTASVRRLVAYSRANDIACLRMCPCPGPTGTWRDGFLGTIGKDDAYRVSLQMAIWNKTDLMSLLREGETAWDVEIRGGQRSASWTRPMLSLWRESDDVPGGPVKYFIAAVRRSEWRQDALDLLVREGIPMDGITKVIP
jgi:hypothetical protein